MKSPTSGDQIVVITKNKHERVSISLPGDTEQAPEISDVAVTGGAGGHIIVGKFIC